MEMTQVKVRDAEVVDALGSVGAVIEYERGEQIFRQGDEADHILFIQEGRVRLSVLNRGGCEGVVGILSDGAFFGEEPLEKHSVRRETATAVVASTLRIVSTQQMRELLRSEPTVADQFLDHMLSRNARLQADLADQLTNPVEKRLARMLVLLARDGNDDRRVSPNISQRVLAEMIGTTRPRVNLCLKRFKQCGFIENDRGIRIKHSLQSVLLCE